MKGRKEERKRKKERKVVFNEYLIQKSESHPYYTGKGCPGEKEESYTNTKHGAQNQFLR